MIAAQARELGREVRARLLALAATELDLADAHVLAGVCAIATAEVHDGEAGSLCEALGLSGAELRALFAQAFPRALSLVQAEHGGAPTVGPAEERLRELLSGCTTSPAPLSLCLAAVVARRAQRPRHLWQDLGLRDRTELSALMLRHFAPLARRNRGDMKWKKFFYRALCTEGGSLLCIAPTCSECTDYQACFGEEA